MTELEIPEEALDTFDYRQMWNDLYEEMARRNLRTVVDLMDNVEFTEYEIWMDKKDWR